MVLRCFHKGGRGIVGTWTTSIVCCGIALALFPLPAIAAGKDASNVGRGSPAQYVTVVGRDFSGEAGDFELRIRVGAIRLESTRKLVATRYTALGIAVYREGKIIGASWNHGIGGELTSAKPSVTLSAQSFVVPSVGPLCLKGGCEVRLQLRVETGSSEAHAEHTDFAALPMTVAPVVAQPTPKPPSSARPAPTPPAGAKPSPTPPAGARPAPRKTVDNEVDKALTAYAENRRIEAEKWLEQALATGPKVRADHPHAALLLYHASDNYERQKMPKQQEQALLWSLAVLEGRPAADVKAALGDLHTMVDKEIVARRLADFYWEQRRYDKAYVYYDRAYRYVADVQMSDTERNRRLARNSAGRMAGACTQGNWAVADQAMKELKERMVKVDAETRKQLEYWVRTGEPRLAARKC